MATAAAERQSSTRLEKLSLTAHKICMSLWPAETSRGVSSRPSCIGTMLLAKAPAQQHTKNNPHATDEVNPASWEGDFACRVFMTVLPQEPPAFPPYVMSLCNMAALFAPSTCTDSVCLQIHPPKLFTYKVRQVVAASHEHPTCLLWA